MFRARSLLFIFLLGLFLGSFLEFPSRMLFKNIYQNEYATLMYRCDSSMKEHFLAKSTIQNKLSEENINNLMSTEVSLIDCHDYDVMRKKLLSLGLNSNDLSLMGLMAIEEKSKDVRDLVRIHEIRY
jgi:hypothetical protein